MIFEYKQIATNPNKQIAVKGDMVLGNGYSSNYLSGQLTIDNSIFNLSFEDGNVKIQSDNSNGLITEKLQKFQKRFFLNPGLLYYELTIDNRLFTIYHIGFGKKDNEFYQFVENNVTVGMIRKHTRVVNRLDSYVCYTKETEIDKYLALWCLFLQSSCNYPFLINGEGNVITNKQYISTKIEKEKFDFSFIEEVELLEDRD